MSTRQRMLTTLSWSAVVAVLAAVGFAGPRLLGLTPGQNAAQASLAALTQGDTARKGIVEHQDILADEGRSSCCAKSKGGCCSAAGGKCCCGKNLLVQAGPAGPQLLALAPAEQGKAEEPKGQMKMASPEAMAKGVTARKAILDHQKALTGDGVYSCCIKPGCTFCSSSADMCPCAMNLAKGDPVCPECWGGWTAGKGNLPGVQADKVQVIPKSKLKMMYDMRSKNFEKAAERK